MSLTCKVLMKVREKITMNFGNLYVLWNDKRGHQLVPLKCIKGAPTHSSFMLHLYANKMVHACRMAQILCRYQISTELIE